MYIFNYDFAIVYTMTNKFEYLLHFPLPRNSLSIDFGITILERDELLSK